MTDWNTADPLEAALRLIGPIDMKRNWTAVDEQFKSAP